VGKREGKRPLGKPWRYNNINNIIIILIIFIIIILLLIIIILLYGVSQEERTRLRDGVPYVILYRYNPKHLYPKFNGLGDNGN